MSMGVCIPQLQAEGKLSAEQADEALALFTELEQDFRRQFGDQAAAAMASDQALAALKAQLTRRRFLAGEAIKARKRMLKDMGDYNGGGGAGGGGPIDPRSGPAFFDGDGRAPYANVEGRYKAVRARAHAKMDGILSRHSANLMGEVRDKAGELDLVREAFGESTGNANAKEFAAAWRETAEFLRQRRNAAGGNTGKIENWGLPQSHDSRKVREAGWEAWSAEIRARVDRGKIIDRRTGLPMSEGAFEIELNDMFEAVRSDGWSRREPGGMGKASMANRRDEARFLVFKSADDWLAYAERFGQGSGFDAMTSHIDAMAREIAQMEIFGPNPNAGVQWLKDTIKKSAEIDKAPGSKAVDQADAAVKQIDRLFNEFTGDSLRPENRNLAIGFSALRSWQVATKLGGAMLSAVTDLAYGMATRSMNGLPATRMLGQYAKLFKPGSLADQQMAVRRGLIAEEWSGRTAAQHRFMGEELTGEVSRRLAEGVLRISGLSRWTQSGRWAFGMEFLATLTEARGSRLAELDPALRRAFERYGISADDWDVIRQHPTIEEGGVDWIDPPSLPVKQGDRLLEMIHRETDFAVPVPDLRTRAMINSVSPRGTIHGEILKSAFLFKSFGIGVMLMHGRRAMELGGWSGARYAGGLVIGTTLMGALAIFLKDLAGGKDPRSANDIPFIDDETGEIEFAPGFWGQAMAQGGGFGIFGDFLKSSVDRRGGGLPSALAGPIVGDLQDLADVATSSNPARAALKFSVGQIPGNNLWYLRTAFDRMLTDQVQMMIDPDYAKSWKRVEDWNAEQGTQAWWPKGETAPTRAPDMTNITEPKGAEP